MKRTAKSTARPRRARPTPARRARGAASPKPASPSPRAKTAAPRRKAASRGRVCVFAATLEERGPTGQWPHVFLPTSATRLLGKRGAVNVVFSANGTMFRRTAKPDGQGGHYVLFNALMRERTGIEPGDRFDAAIRLDPAPRTLEVPPDVTQSLRDDRRAREAFASLTPANRRMLVEFVKEAKRPETRVRRIQQALRMMVEWAAARSKAPR